MSTWTDETKQEAVSMYTDENPTPENSMEIVADIAEQLGQTPNGSTGGTRVSKADAQDNLSSAISDAGMEVDASIIEKLTGKAANYFADIINKINE